jgi:hypothetical protein
MKLYHRFVAGKENGITGAASHEFDLRVSLTLVCLKAHRQFAVSLFNTRARSLIDILFVQSN